MGKIVEEATTQAFQDSINLPVAKIAEYVMDGLGQRIAAASLGMTSANNLRSWAANNGHAPSEEDVRKLRLIYRVTRTITDVFGAETARGFMVNMNPQLDDEAPLVVIADHPIEASESAVLGALSAFVQG